MLATLRGQSRARNKKLEEVGTLDQIRERKEMTIATKDTEVGYELPALSRLVTLETSQVYSGWPQRRNLHTDEEIARKSGFPTVVMEGMLGVSYLSEMLTNFIREGWVKGGKLKVNFIRPVIPPNRLTAKAIVRDKVAEGPAVRLILDIWVENEKGEKVIVGTASGLVL